MYECQGVEYQNCDKWKASILMENKRTNAYKAAVNEGIITDHMIVYHRKTKTVEFFYNSTISHDKVLAWLKIKSEELNN